MAEVYNPYSDSLIAIEEQRQLMQTSGDVSAPIDQGTLCIVVSGTDSRGKRSDVDYGEFIDEAQAFAREQQERYGSVEIVQHVGKEAVFAAITDQKTSGIVFIGHGSLPTYFTETGMISWSDILQARMRLIREVWQATCGHIPSAWQYGIPFGLPLVSQPSGLRAAVGQILPDHALNLQLLIKPVFVDNKPLIPQLDSINLRHMGEKEIVASDGTVVDSKKC